MYKWYKRRHKIYVLSAKIVTGQFSYSSAALKMVVSASLGQRTTLKPLASLLAAKIITKFLCLYSWLKIHSVGSKHIASVITSVNFYCLWYSNWSWLARYVFCWRNIPIKNNCIKFFHQTFVDIFLKNISEIFVFTPVAWPK